MLERFDRKSQPPAFTSFSFSLFGIMSQSSSPNRPSCSPHYHAADDGYRETTNSSAEHAARLPWNAGGILATTQANGHDVVTRSPTMTASHSRIPRGVLASTLSEVLDIANDVESFLFEHCSDDE
jgi:hypothetical protein